MTTEQELPKGWKKTTLGAEFEWSSGGTPKSGIPAYYENGSIHWLNISDLNDGLVSYAEKKITELGLQESSAKIVPQGAVLIAIYGSIGKLGINTIPLATNQAICFTKKIPEYILNKFLFYYLLSIRNQLITMGKGGTQQNISQTVLKGVPFFYPTSKEAQQAIVNKIESLFAEIDEGIGRLKTAAQQIQQYRQSLLKNAFNGELTKEWRSKHADTLPSENELLAQIQTTREQHHAQQLADWQTAVSQWEQNGKEGKKPSKPKKLKEFNQLEGSFSNLPKGWCWVELSGISSVIRIGPFGSLLHKADYINNQIPLINPSHIKNGKIIPDFQLTVSKEKLNELNNYIMRENDIVIGRRGEMGRCAVVTSNENGWLCGTGSMFVRPLNSVSSKFYAYIISSERVKDYLSNSSIGTTMQNLNEKILQTVPVPLCSTQEQLKILRILDVNLTACDQLAAELSKQLKQAELLKQAVLKVAFSGGLLDK
ncbi:restriction endonuclease subunit S [Neisseria polysaccharea]|uniref:restriction endonuclease subunit S n=1 Tax=Neisseria polysaccharea TaxID=489 RepID=UPI00272AD126|nr:restriction endonuclease subunit S [Neisseria polysaccharea]